MPKEGKMYINYDTNPVQITPRLKNVRLALWTRLGLGWYYVTEKKVVAYTWLWGRRRDIWTLPLSKCRAGE